MKDYCVFADPPFNLGKDYKNGFSDKVEEEEYFAWSYQWINECAINQEEHFLYALPVLAIRFANFMSERLDFRHWIALTIPGS